MIDVHHHLLYGLDDGPETIEESIAMAGMAAEDGITHVVCTPHANNRYRFDPQVITARLDQLRDELARAGIGITLGRGCDFHITWENIQDAIANPSKYTINGGQYLLIELPEFVPPMGLENTLNDLRLAGLEPILTHPERNPAIQRNPERMKPWIAQGLIVQVTAGAVVGNFGKKAQKLAHQFLRDNWVHVIATDAHNSTGRPPRLREAFDLIAETYGEGTAHRLCVQNPRSIFEGANLDDQPDPVGAGDMPDSRPSWIRRFFTSSG
jgi:protein-tyrosine phosphatase